MSIEIFVLANARVNSVAEWQRFIDVQGFPLQLSDGELYDDGGSLTGKLRGNQISVEYRFDDIVEFKQFYENIKFGGDWKYVLALPWIHGFDGLTAAWMAAMAYASAVDGVIFDPQEGKVFNSAQALKVTQDIVRTRPQAEAALRNLKQQLSAKS